MSAIRQAVKCGVTVLMIAHRLSTVLSADHVTVLQDGRAVEQGRPSELAREGTVFSGLLTAQNTNTEAPVQENCLGDASTEKETKETNFEQSSSPEGPVQEHSVSPAGWSVMWAAVQSQLLPRASCACVCCYAG